MLRDFMHCGTVLAYVFPNDMDALLCTNQTD